MHILGDRVINAFVQNLKELLELLEKIETTNDTKNNKDQSIGIVKTLINDWE